MEEIGSADIHSSLGCSDSGDLDIGMVSPDRSSTASDHDMDETDFNLSQTVNDLNECEPGRASPEDVKMAAAKFLLTLREKFKLTQASLDYTMKKLCYFC